MEESLTPRQMAKWLLNGVPPSRPLFLPIVFSLGARVENVPLRTFLSNPTKISSSLRQVRTHLRVDGVACYFDPLLEVEALGGTLQLVSEDQPPTISWPQSAPVGELPKGLRSPEEVVLGGRVPVAVEVIRRMNSLANRDFLLIAGVTGPRTLAAQIAGLDRREKGRDECLAISVQEFAASVVTEVTTAFLQAGAELIVIQEEILPARSAESYDSWVNLLAPTINVIRFYEALPVVQLTDARAVLDHWATIFQQQWDCVVSLPAAAMTLRHREGSLGTTGAMLGISLPLEAFRPEGSGDKDDLKSLPPVIPECQHSIITTAGDIPAKADMKRLLRILGEVPRNF
jgi:uroporphyrinogen decarboxylase-like protein